MKDLQFGGNMYIVLVYDISQSEAGQKRWSRIFKICKKYLSHIQNSVFEGEISKPQLMQLKKCLLHIPSRRLQALCRRVPNTSIRWIVG